MGYRWNKGRLVSDTEYHEEKQEEMFLWFQLAGFLVPTLCMGWLGYYLSGGKPLMIALGAVGAIVGYVFNIYLAAAAAVIFIIGLIIGFIAFTWYMFK